MGYVERPAIYRSFEQFPSQTLTIMIAFSGSPTALVAEVQQRLSAIYANLVLSDIDGLRTEQAAALSQPRFRTILLSGFAGLALALALTGLYGLLSQSIAVRTRDIGIRMALGADRGRILRSVLVCACSLTVIGIVIGATAAAATLHFVQAMFYRIEPYGAVELFGTATAVLTVAICAAGRPAFRAASIDPMMALRNE